MSAEQESPPEGGRHYAAIAEDLKAIMGDTALYVASGHSPKLAEFAFDELKADLERARGRE